MVVLFGLQVKKTKERKLLSKYQLVDNKYKMNTKIKILIVDDHPAIRKTMVDVLTEEGFETDLRKRWFGCAFKTV